MQSAAQAHPGLPHDSASILESLQKSQESLTGKILLAIAAAELCRHSGRHGSWTLRWFLRNGFVSCGGCSGFTCIHSIQRQGHSTPVRSKWWVPVFLPTRRRGCRLGRALHATGCIAVPICNRRIYDCYSSDLPRRCWMALSFSASQHLRYMDAGRCSLSAGRGRQDYCCRWHLQCTATGSTTINQ